MSISLGFMQELALSSSCDAWRRIVEFCLQVHKNPLPAKGAYAELSERERIVADVDLFLTASGWDLWRNYAGSVERTSDALQSWWHRNGSGRCVLVLDALSLRELPLLIQGAEANGFKVLSVKATGAEIPPDTTTFAGALGVASRSVFENGKVSGGFRLGEARTEATRMPWGDCAALIRSEPDWFFWHHFPDWKLHELTEAGQGLRPFLDEVLLQLSGQDFWKFLARLGNGRKLVICSDHGYAVSGTFSDCHEEQSKYLKELFKSARAVCATGGAGPFLPPLDLTLDGQGGQVRLVLGQRKWKVQGGYPLLVHGGLSLHEVLCPFIELVKA